MWVFARVILSFLVPGSKLVQVLFEDLRETVPAMPGTSWPYGRQHKADPFGATGELYTTEDPEAATPNLGGSGGSGEANLIPQIGYTNTFSVAA